jgi:hypothetical protein
MEPASLYHALSNHIHLLMVIIKKSTDPLFRKSEDSQYFPLPRLRARFPFLYN